MYYARKKKTLKRPRSDLGWMPPRKKARYASTVRTSLNPKYLITSRPATKNVRITGYTGMEKHFQDLTKAETVIATTWAGAKLNPATVDCLFAPTQGSGVNDRRGIRCTMKSIQVRGLVYKKFDADEDDGSDPVIVRLAIVMDKATNSTAITPSLVYDDTEGNKPFRYRNLENTERFRVLFQKCFVLNDLNSFTDGTNTGSISGVGRQFEFYKDVDVPVKFVSNDGDIGDIQDNSLHVIACCNVANKAYIRYESRVRFVG